MGFDDMRKKYAGIIRSQQEEASKAPEPTLDWGSFELSIPDIRDNVLIPAAKQAEAFLEDMRLSPRTDVGLPILTWNDTPAPLRTIEGVEKSVIDISFGLPRLTDRRGSPISFTGRVHVVVVSHWMRLALSVYAMVLDSGRMYEHQSDIKAEDISTERVAKDLGSAIDGILEAHQRRARS